MRFCGWSRRRRQVPTVLLFAVVVVFLGLALLSTDYVETEEALPVGSSTHTSDRIIEPWKQVLDPTYPWCIPDDEGSSPSHFLSGPGLYLVKIPKAGSSTAAGITHQLAHKIAQRKGYSQQHHCRVEAHHGSRHAFREPPYFLWSMIRRPADRALSWYYFSKVSREGRAPSYGNLLVYGQRTKGEQLHQLASTSSGLMKNENNTKSSPPKPRYTVTMTGRHHNNTTQAQVLEMIQNDILDQFQFIGILERLEESLVVMRLLLFGFDATDMIVLPSKLSGGYDGGGSEHGCVYIQTATPTPSMTEYLQDESYCLDNYDCMLYDILNQTLDATIDMLGRKTVEEGVQLHRRLQSIAEEQCLEEAVFPCSKNGTRQYEASTKSCYQNDWGCGHECVQRVLADAGH